METLCEHHARMCPKVSVIIPAFDRAHTVLRAIESVIGQSLPEWELILIDDGSTDNTERLVRSIPDERIRYIRNLRNSGQSAARNTGIKAAQGTYISFLDSDDEWLPEKLALEVVLFESAPTIGLTYSGENVLDSDGRLLEIGTPRLQGRVFSQLLAKDFIGSCSRVAVRRKILEIVGGFDEGLSNAEDWDLWIRVASICQVAGVPQVLVRRYLGANQVSDRLRGICDSRMKIVEKYRHEMSLQALSDHLAILSIILLNYDRPHARELAFEAIRLKLFQPRLFAALGTSCFGSRIYRHVFSHVAKLRHGVYIGRAHI